MGGLRYRIASFNMYKFNLKSDAEIRKNIENIAKIIISNKFDIVGMQEVLTETVLKYLLVPTLNRLSGECWDYRWESPRYISDDRYSVTREVGERKKGYSNSKNEAEGYAFVWNTRKFKLATKENVVGEMCDVEPRIYNQYRVDKEKGQMPLARNPYYGRFRALDGLGKERNFELRLINTHITYGSSGSTLNRKQEFEILVDQIYKRISKSDATDCPVYSVMLGDYNLNLNRPWTSAPYLENARIPGMSFEIFSIIEKQHNNKNEIVDVTLRSVITKQESLSTLRSPDRENFNPNRALANNYDHFTYDIEYETNGMSPRVYCVNDVDKLYKNDGENRYKTYKKEISDHLPVALDLSL